MIVTRELIEKYHRRLCTPEEEKAVEDWLLDAENENLPLSSFSSDTDKHRIRDEMWEEISAVGAYQKPAAVTIFLRFARSRAAAVLLGLAACSGVFLLKEKTGRQALIVVENSSETQNRDLHESTYSISVGPKSNVEIDNETGRIDFCGALMINPKRDVVVTIQGRCTDPEGKREKIALKKGQNYFALNYRNVSHEVVILPQGSLAGLPPLMQRQLMAQFNI